MRIGIIGCDTSHAVAFAEVLNNPDAKSHVPGGKVVAAYKGGSPDIPQSISRVEEYATTLHDKYGVEICPTIEDLCQKVDVVLLESVDGRRHLEQVKPVLAAHKPVFVDKPIAASLRDTVEIFHLAKKAHVPLFSSSALPFARETQAVRAGAMGKITCVEAWGPCEQEPHHPELFWYGVHSVSVLCHLLGPGCRTVQRGTGPDGKVEVVGYWSGGRVGIFREDKSFHGLAWGEKGEAAAGAFDGYGPLVVEIMKFFHTGIAPISPEETIEISAFMEAAAESKAKEGAPVRVRY